MMKTCPSGIAIGIGVLSTLFAGMPETTTAEESATEDARTIEVYFSPEPRVIPAIVKEILGAKRTLDVAMYSFSIESARLEKPTSPNTKGKSKEEREALQKTYQEAQRKYRDYRQRVKEGRISIVDALAEARSRGVVVRVAFNEGHLGEWKNFQSQELQRTGVELRYTTWTMHEKFGVFDGKTLITGSANWSTTGALVYNESTLVFREHPEMIRKFQEEFDRIWERAKPYPPEKKESGKAPDRESADAPDEPKEEGAGGGGGK